MSDWARYRTNVVSEVFGELGAAVENHKNGVWVWSRLAPDGFLQTEFVQPSDPDGLPGMGADIVAVHAERLEFDVADVFARLKSRGGEIL